MIGIAAWPACAWHVLMCASVCGHSLRGWCYHGVPVIGTDLHGLSENGTSSMCRHSVCGWFSPGVPVTGIAPWLVGECKFSCVPVFVGTVFVYGFTSDWYCPMARLCMASPHVCHVLGHARASTTRFAPVLVTGSRRMWSFKRALMKVTRKRTRHKCGGHHARLVKTCMDELHRMLCGNGWSALIYTPMIHKQCWHWVVCMCIIAGFVACVPWRPCLCVFCIGHWPAVVCPPIAVGKLW